MANYLVWFRSDLRIHDHAPLTHALEKARAEKGNVFAAFIYSEAQLRSHDNGPNRFAALQIALLDLRASLNALGIELVLIHSDSWAAGVEQLIGFCQQQNIQHVVGHREPGLNELKRDQRFAALAEQHAIGNRIWEDACLIPPEQLLNGQGGFYKVFTAYKKRWLSYIDQFLSSPLVAPGPIGNPVTQVNNEPWQQFTWDNPLDIAITEQQAQQRIDYFSERSKHYGNERDLPALDGTSQLSVALSLGSISSRQLIAQFLYRRDEGSQKWVSEVIWREFYKYLLYWRPELCMHQPFDKKWDAFPWQHDEQRLARWQQGTTGVPIVDAGMRQLLQTGWMHNRMRMVTAMYLVKILKQDWRLGEAWFAQQLADIDFSANNGGWQWCASTGVDAAPYFRIFNPYQQAKRFDLQGTYIRTYVKELARAPVAAFQKVGVPLTGLNYPKPVCDYALERTLTLDQFKHIGTSHDTDH